MDVGPLLRVPFVGLVGKKVDKKTRSVVRCERAGWDDFLCQEYHNPTLCGVRLCWREMPRKQQMAPKCAVSDILYGQHVSLVGKKM